MYYSLDVQAAKEASSLSNRITDKGRYVGTFIRAQHITSKNGVEGIDFDFLSDDEKRARFFLYTRRDNGDTTYGYKQLMTIIACMKLSGLQAPQMQAATVWDSDAQEEKQAEVPQFVELLGKPIGLLLHMEEYRPLQGEDTKWRVVFSHAFEPQTDLMACEILDGKSTPEQLAKAVAVLKNKQLKVASATTTLGSSSAGRNSYEATKNGSSLRRADQGVAGEEGLEADDIPF